MTSTPRRRRAYNSASVRPYVACDCSLVSLVSADLREDLYFCRAAERALRHTCRLFRIPGHIVERSASAGHSQTDISPSPDALSCPAIRTRFSLPSLPLPSPFLSPSGCKSCSRFTGGGESSQSGRASHDDQEKTDAAGACSKNRPRITVGRQGCAK